MTHTTHQDVIKRLKRADGHLRKIIAMIEAERSCVDVAQQLHAVSRAVEEAKRVFVHDHIDSCLHGAAEDGRESRELFAEFKEISKYL